MTADQKLQWIALPAGVGPDGRPRVAAYLAPRLRTDTGRLDGLPDFVDWPAHVARATWQVEADGVSLPASVTSAAPIRPCGRRCSRPTRSCAPSSSPTTPIARW